MVMSLKELAHCVHETLDANKDKWGLVACESQYFLTYEESEKLFAWAGEIDESEVENLNNSFWDAGIQPRDFDEIARAIAIILETRCVTPEDVEKKTKWLKQLQENANAIVRRINLRQPPSEKKHEKEWRYGEFTKFDFIQAYGYMYDNDDEANADANDTSSTCPLLMRLLNSGWANIKAVEDKATGKITVSKREENVVFSPALFLAKIAISFETLCDRHEYKIKARLCQADNIAYALRRKDSIHEQFHSHADDVHWTLDELYGALQIILTDKERYPQDVYDFQTLNKEFLKLVKNAINIMENLDETQHDIARQLFLNLLDGMRQLSEVESKLVVEQKERDPQTHRFLHPKYDISNNIYTLCLGTLIFKLEGFYMRANRMSLTDWEIWQRQPENKGMWYPFSSWEETKMAEKYVHAQYHANGEKLYSEMWNIK